MKGKGRTWDGEWEGKERRSIYDYFLLSYVCLVCLFFLHNVEVEKGAKETELIIGLV